MIRAFPPGASSQVEYYLPIYCLMCKYLAVRQYSVFPGTTSSIRIGLL
jgi:hypothetical protein